MFSLKQVGVVTNVLDDKNAMVLVKRHSSCESCNACKMGREEKTLEVEAINRAQAQVGQNVTVDLEHQNVLKAAFIIYLIPLITLIFTVAITIKIFDNELISALVGFISMAIVFLVIKKNEHKFKDNEEYVPVITEIIETE